MRRRSSTPGGATTSVAMPRDVEAVEVIIDALDAGVTDVVDAHRRITETLVSELGIGYGAVWLPGPDGAFHLVGEWGELAPAIGASPGGRITSMTSTDGYAGMAIRSRKTVVADATSDNGGCARWAGARAAGAQQGCVLPLVEDGVVAALYEYYDRSELPFVGQRQGKWDSLGRLLSHARRAAIGKAQLK